MNIEHVVGAFGRIVDLAELVVLLVGAAVAGMALTARVVARVASSDVYHVLRANLAAPSCSGSNCASLPAASVR